jgi:hypothetical protein
MLGRILLLISITWVPMAILLSFVQLPPDVCCHPRGAGRLGRPAARSMCQEYVDLYGFPLRERLFGRIACHHNDEGRIVGISALD